MKKVKYPGRKTSKIRGRAYTEKSKTLHRGNREDLNNRGIYHAHGLVGSVL